jgi:hypothetical protein
VPELHLRFGPPDGRSSIAGTVTVDNTRHVAKGTTLADSGAFNSCITANFASRVKTVYVQIHKSKMPTLTMANGARTQPKGLVHLQVHLTHAIFISVFAWVLASGPFDFIMGSEVLTRYAANIDYGNHILRLRVRDTEVVLPFELAPE